ATLDGSAAILAAVARLEGLARVDRLDQEGACARAVVAGCEIAIPLAGVLDLDGERRRLQRDIDKLSREEEGHARKLSNADFLGKARPEIIDKERRIDQELLEKIARLTRTLQSLG
ncbi:MAG TPA: hypothetical protein VGA64_01510, partial [Candidatus Polarisedimenticolia bacterium]